MPVSTESSVSGPYTPNGATTDFAFDFKATSADEVVALDQDGATISAALYSVTLDEDEGGTLSFSVAPALTDYTAIYVASDPALTQPSDFDNTGPSYNPAALTRALDRAAARDLKLRRELDGVLKAPFPSAFSNLPGASARKGKLLGFSSVDGDVEMQDFAITSLDGDALTTRAALAAISAPTAGQLAILTSFGIAGSFAFDSSDLSAEVAVDTEQGVYIPPTSDPTGASGAWVRRYDGPLRVSWFNAVGDGSSDDTDSLVAALNVLNDGETLDLDGLHLNIFVGVAGVASGDAIAISGVPRLFEKNNVTIQNGKITADSPGVAGSKLRYPTTLTIDGCDNVTLRNLTVHSRGQNYGDTDASSGESAEDRREFAAQNGGHAILVVRSIRTNIENCQARLCGSVGAVYVMSSHETKIKDTFANAGSLGYAAYAFDSWAGDASVSGFAAHASYMTNCSSSKEGYTYGSKGCVVTEDADVTVTVEGGYFADAYPNGSARDIGYAFGGSSSQTIVNNAVVENCAAIGYAGTTNGTDYTYLKISNVYASGLRKTVHQDEDTATGRTYAEYVNVTAKVAGGGTWAGDGDITREQTSYIALPNAANRIGHTFTNCQFTGASNGILTDNAVFGSLVMTACKIETNGNLWIVAGIGGGSAGAGITRGVVLDRCAIEDISSDTDAYCQWVSSTVFVYVDLSTSTIKLNSVRDIESRTISSPSTYIQRYQFPRPEFGTLDISGASVALQANSAKHLRVTLSAGAARSVGIFRPDVYRGQSGIITNADATNDVLVRDYTLTTTLLTLTPGQSARWYNDGTASYVVAL